MRKSFTRFLSVLMLFCAFGLQAAFAQSSHWLGDKSTPKDEFTNVKPGDIATQFVLAFDEAPVLTAAGGTLAVYNGAGAIVGVVPVNRTSANISVVGKTLVVKHGIASIKEETNYRIILSSSAITVDGQPVGISDSEWTFTTGDFTAPKLVASSPLSPVGKVEENLNPGELVLKFNEDVVLGEGNVAIYQENGTVVELIDVTEGDIAIDGSEVTITISPDARFLPQTNYYVRVAAGAFTDDVTAYEDATANAYAGITGNTAWKFTTRDTSAPNVTLTVSNITDATAKLNVTLSEAGSFKWYVGATDPTESTVWSSAVTAAANSTKVVSVSSLDDATTYYAYVVATNTEDPANVTTLDEAIDAKVKFVTVDKTGPVADARGIINTAKKTTGVYIYFDEQVKGGTGELVVRRKSNNEAVVRLGISAVSSVQIPEDADEYAGLWKATLNFGKALASNEEYYVVFPEGYITDMLGNKYVTSGEGINVPVNYTGIDAWEITSSDFEAPVVSFWTTTTSADDATTSPITGVDNGASIKIQFDEEVVLADGEGWGYSTDFEFWSKYVAFQKAGITVEAEYSYSDGVLTIDPVGTLDSNTTYTVILRPGVIMDASENENLLVAGVTNTISIGDNDDAEFTFGPTTELGALTPMTITFAKDVFVKSSATVKAALATSNLAGLIAIDKEGTAVADDDFTMVYNATTKTITVTPKATKAYATSVCADEANVVYHLVLTTTNLVDSKFAAFTATNASTAPGTRNYEVSDYKAPAATLIASSLTETDINTDKLTITYDEEVSLLDSYVDGEDIASQIILKKNNASGENLPFTASIVSAEGDPTVIEITPAGGAWAKGTYYYGIGSSMEDGDCHNVAAAAYKSFTVTADAVPTTLTALTYTINGGSSNAIDYVAPGVTEKTAGGLTIVVTFDQAIDDADLTIVPQLTTTLPFTALTSSSVNGNKLTINIPASVVLASKGEYSITIPQGLVEGNATYNDVDYAQLPNAGVTISFISADSEVPVVTPTTPTADATLVALDLDEDGFTLTFDEEVVLGTGSITFTAAGDEDAEQTITVNSANVSLAYDEDADETVATIATADLKMYNTVYTVVIENEAFKDLAGNDLGDDDIDFSFTTDVNPQPEVLATAGLYPANGSDNVAHSLDLTMKFTEPVLQASTSGSRKLVYVFKVDPESANRASIDPVTGDVDPGDDEQVYYAYVDILTSVGVSGSLVTVKGVTLTADAEYYVLVTPGAFIDISEGEDAVDYPVPGVYAGITNYDDGEAPIWHFYTGDVIPAVASLDFTKYGLDEKVATDSDIKLVFTKAVQNYIEGEDAIDIENAEIPNLVKLYKNTGTHEDPIWDEDNEIEFTGTISSDKKTITIDNSSLVVLEEMKGSTEYKVAFDEKVFVGTDGTPLDSWSEIFETSDYAAPAAPAIDYTYNENGSIYFDTDEDANVHTAELTLSDESEGDVVKLYYFWTADLDVVLTPLQVKDLGTVVDIEDAPADLVFNTGMVNETEYKVVAVAEDAAGNLSEVGELVYTTDDVVAPELAEALPTNLSATEKLNLVFNEDVVPVEDAYARIIDANGVTYHAQLAQLDEEDNEEGNIITIQIDALGLPISDDVATYTVEVDPGMIVDVPREISEGVYANEPNAFAGILGTSFSVSSDDEVAPELDSTDPDYNAEASVVDVHPTFTLNFSEAVNLNDEFTQFVIYEGSNATDAVVALKAATITSDDPYDVLTADNVSGEGTSTITLTTNRALVSGNHYYLVVDGGTFSDLSENAWEGGDVTIDIVANDVTPLPTVFRVYYNVVLPQDEPLDFVPDNACVVFGYYDDEDEDVYNTESFYINPNDEIVNTYDLTSHLWLKADGVDIPFTFSYDNDRIRLSPVEGFGDYRGKTITYGFTNLYDENGNLNAGAEASFSISETAVEERLVTFTPGDNDDDTDEPTNIAVDQTFKVEFDGIIYSYSTVESEDNLIMSASLLESLGVFTMEDAELEVVSYTEAGGKSVVTLKATEDLVSEEDYTLVLNANKIQIGQGDVTVLGEYYEPFMTADVVAPKLIAEDGETLPEAYLPNNGSTVAKDQTLGLVFDEPVVGAGSIEIHRWDGVLIATVDITGVESDHNMIEIADLTEVMAANQDFKTDTKYYVVVPAGAIVDLATTPNAFAGITHVNEWTFDLRDDANPAVTFVQNMKTGVAVDSKMQFTFDRPVTGGYGWFAVYEETDGDAVALVRIPPGADVDGVLADEFTLGMDLAENTKYYAELGEGSYVLAADALTENPTPTEQVNIGEWWFTTETNEKPLAVEYSPVKADPMTTGVALNSGLSVTFDQEVTAGTGNIQLHRKQNVGGPIVTTFNVADPTKVSFSGNTLTIAGSVLNLQNNSEYYVIIPATAVKNTSSSPEYFDGIVVPFVWQFTTINDQLAPTAVYAPVTTGLVPADVKLTMTFNESVVVNTGSVVVYNAADDAVVETVALTPAMLVGNVVTVVPTTIKEGMSYYVNVSAGAVKDIAGNNFAGVTNKTDWTFATGDFTAPKFVSGTPTGTMTEGNHPTFELTFDENVVLGTGNLKVIKKDLTTPVLTIPVTSAVVVGKKVTVTYVTPATGGLDKNTDYYVLVDAGVVKDAAGNASAAVTDVAKYTFKTGAEFTTDVPDIDNSLEFNIFPNPFVDEVTVNNASKLSKVVVSNIAGQAVKEVVAPDSQIQLSELRSGVYFMSLYQGNVVIKTVKIIKR